MNWPWRALTLRFCPAPQTRRRSPGPFNISYRKLFAIKTRSPYSRHDSGKLLLSRPLGRGIRCPLCPAYETREYFPYQSDKQHWYRIPACWYRSIWYSGHLSGKTTIKQHAVRYWPEKKDASTPLVFPFFCPLMHVCMYVRYFPLCSDVEVTLSWQILLKPHTLANSPRVPVLVASAFARALKVDPVVSILRQVPCQERKRDSIIDISVYERGNIFLSSRRSALIRVPSRWKRTVNGGSMKLAVGRN